MKRLILSLIVAATICAGAHAQNYSFAVPEMELHVTVNPDASVRMNYMIKFYCNPGADAVDIVDIGLPDYNYDFSNMSASIDGQPLLTIRKSEYLTSVPAVEVPIVPPIEPGSTGVFEFQCTMPDRVYQDTTKKTNASLRITPTWFDSSSLTGDTQLSIVIYMPKDIPDEEILWQLNQPFTHKLQVKDHKAVAWYYDAVRVDTRHMVGVSFPKASLDRVVTMSNWTLFMRWWKHAGAVRFWIGLITLVLFSIFFFRVTAGTGFCLYFILLIGLAIAWGSSPELQLLFIPFFILVWIIARNMRLKAKRSYLPAIASVPGGEIKRGLAAPEVAVMMEQPLGRVLTFVIFGMLKKRLIVQTDEDPLTVAIVEGYDVPRRDRRRLARERGTTIRGFEQDFIEVMIADPGVPVRKLKFDKAMKKLVENTAKRLAGFDLERTREYYQSIMNKAWSEAKEIGDLTQRTEYLDNHLGWLLLHDDSDSRFNVFYNSGYNYRPAWVRTTSGPLLASAPSAPIAPGSGTTAGDVGASFSGWLENVTGGMARSMDPIGVGLTNAPSVNLGGMDKVTGAMLKAMSESSGSGGGFSGGGGCACACAGCACACACAGGGR